MTTPSAPFPKQVLLIRKDLKMPTGKIAAQASHGAQCSFTHAPRAQLREGPAGWELVIPVNADDIAWLQGEYKKVTLGVPTGDELLQIYASAQSLGLRTFLVVDNGHTVFNGVKTVTALAIGPALPEVINPLTGHLRPL